MVDTTDPPLSISGPKPPLRRAEPRWPMALAIVVVAILRVTLPPSLRISSSPWLISVFTLVLLVVIILADPGRIDRQATWLHLLHATLIGFISVANGWSAVQLVADILV